MPNLLRMSFIGTNKHSKRHELGIFYDTTKLGETTLENEMLSRITNDERFKAE